MNQDLVYVALGAVSSALTYVAGSRQFLVRAYRKLIVELQVEINRLRLRINDLEDALIGLREPRPARRRAKAVVVV
jgi:hypothetical protein